MLDEQREGVDARGGARGTISVTDAVKQFEGGVLAVDHVSFEAAPGEFVSHRRTERLRQVHAAPADRRPDPADATAASP